MDGAQCRDAGLTVDVIQHIMTDRIWEWDDRCRLMRSGIVVLDTGIILVRSLPTNITQHFKPVKYKKSRLVCSVHMTTGRLPTVLFIVRCETK